MRTNQKELGEIMKFVTVCKYFGLNVNLNIYNMIMKTYWRSGDTENTKCNNHETKKVESFKFSGSKR
jgi:hypothetical protein